MRKNKSIVVLLLSLVVLQLALLPIIKGNSLFANKNDNNTNLTTLISNPTSKAAITTPGPNGMEIVKSNVLYDGGFEEERTNGEPEAFYGTGTGYSYINHSYQDEVHNGNYAAIISSKGTAQYTSYASTNKYVGYSPYSLLSQDISFEMWFNAKANPDFAFGAEQYLRLQIVAQDHGNVYINYYFSRTSGLPSNDSTNYAYYDLRGSLDTWRFMDRNITEDFVLAFPTYNTTFSYVRRIYVFTTSIVNPTGYNTILIDELSLRNSTNYDFIPSNGDFESGDSSGWSDRSTGPGSLYLTEADSTQGSSSMNITASNPESSTIISSYIYAETDIYNGWGSVPKAWINNQPGDLVFSFDWKYSDSPTLGRQYSYFYMYCSNGSYELYLYFVIGDENDNMDQFTNISYSSYAQYFVKAPNFGSRNTWEHFSFDAYEIISTFNTTKVVPYYIGFYASNYNVANNNVQLLVDDFRITTYPAGDPTFENNKIETTSDPFNYWEHVSNHNYANITSDAFEGSYAANLTSYAGLTTIYCLKNTYLQVDDNLFTDFYWRLDQMTDLAALGYSEIRLEIDDSDYIHYVLGNNSYYSPTNGSQNYYYFVDGHNQIGSWNNLFRNVQEDIVTAFGAGNYNITQIRLQSYGAGSEIVGTIFDNIHFVRDIEAPIISDLDRTPLNPEYNDTVDISVTVEDNIMVDSVNIMISVDAGPFVATSMSEAANTYSASIASYDYDTTISYYIEATDIYGHQSQLGSELDPFTYTVADTVDPILVYEAPPETQILNGSIIFNFTDFSDVGSGIASFEIIFNESVVLSDTEPPASYTLDTEIYSNDDYTLTFRLADNAGNIIEETLSYTIYNPPTWWESFLAFATSPLGIFTWSASGAVVLGIVVLVLVVKARRKKRLANA